MLFNTLSYLIFLPLVVIIYYIIPGKYRYIWLLIVSYYFYMQWNAKYALLMLASTAITYISGILISRFTFRKDRLYRSLKKLCLILCLSFNIGLLFIFKYLNFAIANINRFFPDINTNLFGINDIALNIILPVGISFYIFQAMGYTIDVYRGDVKAEKNFLFYALFVSFFPQLVAGPIERSTHLFGQLKDVKQVSYDNITTGLKTIFIGYFKKVAIADVCAIYVSQVYDNVNNFNGLTLLMATVLFTIQLYCDFSGYSDIAVGSARLMGYKLTDNFNSPYFSESISEYWRRWHITLSSWLRDYIYIPLGGNRKGVFRKCINLVIVFLISGLWHGAEWHYVFWGIYYGLLLVMETILAPYILKFEQSLRTNNNMFTFYRFIRIMLTMFLVILASVLFRANNMSDAVYIFKNLFRNISVTQFMGDYSLIESEVFFQSISFSTLLWGTLLLNSIILFIIDFYRKFYLKKNEISDIFATLFLKIRYLVYVYGGLSIIIWFIFQNGTYFQSAQFLYFQF